MILKNTVPFSSGDYRLVYYIVLVNVAVNDYS